MARYGTDYGRFGRGNRGRDYTRRSPGLYGADYDTGRGGNVYGANFGNYGYTGRGNVGMDYYGGGEELRGGASFGMERGPGYGRDLGLSYGNIRGRGFEGRTRGFAGRRGGGALRGYDRDSYGAGFGNRFETTSAADIARRNFYDREFF